MTYTVSSGTLNSTIPYPVYSVVMWSETVVMIVSQAMKHSSNDVKQLSAQIVMHLSRTAAQQQQNATDDRPGLCEFASVMMISCFCTCFASDLTLLTRVTRQPSLGWPWMRLLARSWASCGKWPLASFTFRWSWKVIEFRRPFSRPGKSWKVKVK